MHARHFGAALTLLAGVPFAGCPQAPDAGAQDGGTRVEDDAGPDGGIDAGSYEPAPVFIEPDTQRDGDPDEGYAALVNAAYVGCGLPWSVYSLFGGGVAPEHLRLDGRTGRNETLIYNQTSFIEDNGVEVVTANCLLCHASVLEDRVVVGLGDTTQDFTRNTKSAAELAGIAINDDDERASWERWKSRVVATADYVVTRTRGTNPADNLAAILFAHRDRDTLAWSDEPLMEPPPREPVPTDVPAWWLYKKKNAMFYTASGRGDHARIMMTASTLCIDDVEQADGIDKYFDDVRAYILSIEPPAYPAPLDDDQVAAGREIFEARCASCHGTYGPEGSYPNLLIPLEVIGTDPALVQSAHFDDRFVDWFNESFYGAIAHLEPGAGYVAPPLDGIWATAPYLHNGLVPTLELVLDSPRRPTYFERAFDPAEYDVEAPGWPYTALEFGHDDIDSFDARAAVYDTTHLGYGNDGHTFGDDLDDAAREDLVAYLKSL